MIEDGALVRAAQTDVAGYGEGETTGRFDGGHSLGQDQGRRRRRQGQGQVAAPPGRAAGDVGPAGAQAEGLSLRRQPDLIEIVRPASTAGLTATRAGVSQTAGAAKMSMTLWEVVLTRRPASCRIEEPGLDLTDPAWRVRPWPGSHS